VRISYFDGSAPFFSQFRTINSAPKMQFHTGAKVPTSGCNIPF